MSVKKILENEEGRRRVIISHLLLLLLDRFYSIGCFYSIFTQSPMTRKVGEDSIIPHCLHQPRFAFNTGLLRDWSSEGLLHFPCVQMEYSFACYKLHKLVWGRCQIESETNNNAPASMPINRTRNTIAPLD